MKLYFKDQTFSYELLRAVSYSGYQGAELGECLSIASKIKNGDFFSWFASWNKTAEHLQKLGESCLKSGRRVSGREALLRASNYYRTAEFFLPPDDSNRKATYARSVETFRKAMSNMDFHCETVKIPYEDSYLSGYFYRVLLAAMTLHQGRRWWQLEVLTPHVKNFILQLLLRQ